LNEPTSASAWPALPRPVRQIVMTRHGSVEYTNWGEGAAVLVIHGAGGGYDQGVAIARAFGGEGFRWISPSRFGYLRTSLPADDSTAGSHWSTIPSIVVSVQVATVIG
jgi:pimeloyl-ACP methyl ester carboxylesterase